MTAGRFVGLLVALFVGTALLVWVLVSLAALVYALSEGDSGATTTYAGFAVAGLVVAALAVVLGRRLSGRGRARH